jgi:hypothetical protein
MSLFTRNGTQYKSSCLCFCFFGTLQRTEKLVLFAANLCTCCSISPIPKGLMFPQFRNLVHVHVKSPPAQSMEIMTTRRHTHTHTITHETCMHTSLSYEIRRGLEHTYMRPCFTASAPTFPTNGSGAATPIYCEFPQVICHEFQSRKT